MVLLVSSLVYVKIYSSFSEPESGVELKYELLVVVLYEVDDADLVWSLTDSDSESAVKFFPILLHPTHRLTKPRTKERIANMVQAITLFLFSLYDSIFVFLSINIQLNSFSLHGSARTAIVNINILTVSDEMLFNFTRSHKLSKFFSHITSQAFFNIFGIRFNFAVTFAEGYCISKVNCSDSGTNRLIGVAPRIVRWIHLSD